MTLHIICERDVGLFSLIQQVVAHLPWAAGAGRVPVVHFEGRCCYWVSGGYRGCSTVWEYYFEPLNPDYPAESLPRVVRDALRERFPQPHEMGFWLRPSVWVSSHFGDHPQLKGKTLAIPYGWRDPDSVTREQAARLIQEHVRPRVYLREKADAFFDQHMAGRTVIGVQIRGTDAVSQREDRAHRKGSLVLEKYRQEVQRCVGAAPEARLFLATDDQNSLNYMSQAFGDRVLAYASRRHDGGEPAGRGPTGCLMPAYVARDRTLAAANGEEAIIEYLLLSRCALLVHNGSSLARTVLLKNPTLPHINTNRRNALLAHAQSFSFRKLRRLAKRALRLTKGALNLTNPENQGGLADAWRVDQVPPDSAPRR
jgi:hypothetical protein